MEVNGHSSTPGERAPPYLLDMMVGGPQSRSGREEKISHLLGLKLQPLGRPSNSQSLYRLRYPGSFYYKLHKLKF
jgi:hypothetical protein